MKLFGDFEAVKFCEENMIFVTHNGYLYYIYDSKYNYWRKYRNAGNDYITVDKYPDVSKDDLIDAMQGVFPQKETDFMRLCHPRQLRLGDMLELLKEDYFDYMSEELICHTVCTLLLESDICYKSFEKLMELFDNAIEVREDSGQVLNKIKELSFSITGRDVFKKEIGIVDGHDCSSYFWIRPVRIIDYSDTNDIDNVAKMSSAEISIEEDDVKQYLTPFLYKYYDAKLEANKKRIDAKGFEWYLTHNFFTFASIRDLLKDIRDTIDALESGRENEFTVKLREKEDNTETDLIIDFYHRFIYRMEYMLTIGKEKGYDLISFMGP